MDSKLEQNVFDEQNETFQLIFAGFISIIVFILIVTATDKEIIDKAWKLPLILNIVLCYVISLFGKDRKIGYLKSYFCLLLLSPLIGCIIMFVSPRLTAEPSVNKMDNLKHKTKFTK